MIDDLQSAGDDRQLNCDVCIVGSGAAGLAIAMELVDTSLRVVVLESGGEVSEEATQRLYDARVLGTAYAGAEHGRFRVFGGSTTQWGGQALPLAASDFEERHWVPRSGWPIKYEDLQPYYRRAERFLQVGDENFDTDVFSLFKIAPPAFNPRYLKYHASKWSPTPNLGRLYRTRISRARNTILLLHANVTEVLLDEYRRSVNRVVARTLTGRLATIHPREVVLCCGGLETARILLANNEQFSCGLGNEYDLVGRYLQDHPGALVGTVLARDADSFQDLFNLHHSRGIKYSLRCSATRELQLSLRILNASVGIMFVPGASSFTDLRTLYRGVRSRRLNREIIAALLHIGLHPREVAKPVLEYLFARRTYTPAATFRLGITTEQEPNPDSRIRLGSERDSLGMRKLITEWRLTDATWHTVSAFLRVVKQQFEQARLGTIELEEWFSTPGAWKEKLVDHYHHMGTTRMHASPTQGVVDAECRVHGIENLYVGSSAVFPTSGHSNPTLTIVALCIRIADRLLAEFRNRSQNRLPNVVRGSSFGRGLPLV